MAGAKRRNDGSIHSANTPGGVRHSRQQIDEKLYKVILIRIFYTDNPLNLSKGAKNPEIVYEGLVVGGKNEGQKVSNIRDANYLTGGKNNFGERVYRVNSKPITGAQGIPLSEQDGDLVYVLYIDGRPSFPVIVGAATNQLDGDNTGALTETGPRALQEYNGVLQLINKDGEYLMVRKGGVLDKELNVFEPGKNQEGKSSSMFFDKEGSILFIAKDGSFLSLNAKTGEVSITQKDGNLIAMTSDAITIAHKDGKQLITIDDSKIQTTSDGDLIEQSNSHTVDTGSFSVTAKGEAAIEGGVLGGKLNIDLAGKVALGNSSAELLDLVDQILVGIQAQTYLGNLGFPTPPPINAATFAAIKVLLALIKGTL